MGIRETIFINVEGTRYPFYIGINSTAIYCDLRKCDLVQYYEDILSMLKGVANPSITRDLIWSCIKEGARREKIEFTEDNYFVGDIMDSIGKDGIEKMLIAITESLPKNNDTDNTDEVIEGDAKKKG